MPDPTYSKIILLLDCSGSMRPRQEEVISGFNDFIDKQRKEPGTADVSLILFNDEVRIVYEDKPLDKVENLTSHVYYTGGFTAYYDALGMNIPKVGEKLALMEEDKRPGNVIVVVITDGLENASKEFPRSNNGREQVREMIIHQQDKYNWKFVFIGSDINTEKEAQSLGIDVRGVKRFKAGHEKKAFLSASSAVSCTRATGDLGDSWKEADVKKDQDKPSDISADLILKLRKGEIK